MKSNDRKIRLWITIIGLFLIGILFACYIVVPKGVQSMQLVTDNGDDVGEEIKLYIGSEMHIDKTVEPEAFAERTMTFQIADEDVAVIDESGVLQGKTKGETLLTAQVAGVKKSVKVTVASGVKKIKNLDDEITLVEGNTYQLEPELTMAEKGLKKPKITYKSADKSIATVSKEGVVTAVDPGTTTITVSAGDKTKKVTVNVNRRVVATPKPKPATKTKTKKKTTSGGGGGEGGWED